MNIAVVGAGAMGCLYGGLLHTKGHKAVLIDLWAEHISAINQHGLTIETDQGQKNIRIPAKYAHEITSEPDLLIVFTKTFHTLKAMEEAKSFIGKQTTVLTLQNGLGNVEKIEQFVSTDKIIAGVTNFPCDLVGPGRIKTTGSGQTKIMSVNGKRTKQLENIQRALDDAGFNCEISNEVYASIWEKVAFNAAINALTAVTMVKVGQLGSVPQGVELACQVVDEVIEVANQKNIPARKDEVVRTLKRIFVEHSQHVPSMLQDVLAQRHTEIEAINGAVALEAAKMNIPVPATEVLYKLIRVIEQSYGQQVEKNI